MAVKDRNLEAGTRLVARYKKREYKAIVVETEEGIRYRLEDGREFKSLSSAGSALMNGVACNGWRFWSLAHGGEAQTAEGRRSAKARRRSLVEPKAESMTCEEGDAPAEGTAHLAGAATGTEEQAG